MDRINFEIKGTKVLADALENMPRNASKAALSSGVRAGAAVMGKRARELAPINVKDPRRRQPGRLRRNIVWQINRRWSLYPYRIAFDIGVRNEGKTNDMTNAFYWYFLEFGTVKMAARPFLRPASKEAAEPAIRAIAGKLQVAIMREAQKYNSRKS